MKSFDTYKYLSWNRGFLIWFQRRRNSVGYLLSYFQQENKNSEIKKDKRKNRNLNFAFLLSLMLFIFFGSFFLLKLNSFIGTILAFAITTIIIYAKRHDLIKDSLLSGVILMLLSFLGYHLLNLITPGFFDKFWLFKNIGKIIFLGIPLEEYVWFFLAGCLIGPLYEYWKEGKLIKNKN